MTMAEPEAMDHDAVPAKTRLLYRSANGDSWLLVKDGAGRVWVEHRPNIPSGGRERIVDLADFLTPDHAGPEHAELVRLIGTLVDAADAGAETS